jgi:hypothetical protein
MLYRNGVLHHAVLPLLSSVAMSLRCTYCWGQSSQPHRQLTCMGQQVVRTMTEIGVLHMAVVLRLHTWLHMPALCSSCYACPPMIWLQMQQPTWHVDNTA